MPSHPAEDYYTLLGVPPTVDDKTLRTAWRRLAAQWHPDRAGASATATFQQLSAAYTVLSDPTARAAYDRRHGHTPRPAATAPPPPRAATTTTPPRPARPSAPAVMLSRLCKHLSTLLNSGAAEIEDDGVITLTLRQDEAAQGGMITIPMNIDLWCPDCAAKGRPPAGCRRCGGTRTIPELYSAWLAVPPGATSGTPLTPSATLPGTIDPVRFRIRLRV
jgi:hypothetical protein